MTPQMIIQTPSDVSTVCIYIQSMIYTQRPVCFHPVSVEEGAGEIITEATLSSSPHSLSQDIYLCNSRAIQDIKVWHVLAFTNTDIFVLVLGLICQFTKEI